MSNGNHQLEHLIEEATDRVAEDGSNAEQVDIMLAGFGYLAYQINRPQWYSRWPVSFSSGSLIGASVIGGIMRWLGS